MTDAPTFPTPVFRDTPVSELHLHPRNPRNGNIAVIQESIRTHGIYKPLVAQVSSGNVLAGNHTLQAAVAEGYATVPVNWVDVDDVEALEILLVDNGAADKATNDNPRLVGLLKELQAAGSLVGTGYTETDVTELERLAGDLAKRNAKFLDDLANKDDDGDDPDAEKRPPSQYFNLAFLVTLDDRAAIMDVLNGIVTAQGFEGTTQAIMWLCQQYAAQVPVE